MVVVTPVFQAIGGNRISNAADWAHGVLAFGAGANVALWDPQNHGRGISAILPPTNSNQGDVHAVKILRHRRSGRVFLVVGTADGSVTVFECRRRDTLQNCRLDPISGVELHKLYPGAHSAAVHALTVLPHGCGFISAAADASIVVWAFDDAGEGLEQQQTIHLKPRFMPLALAVVQLEDGVVALAVAGTRSPIQLYTRLGSEPDAQFALQATLTGHEGWVRSLDFTTESSTGDVLLASASQDKYIRLWRFRRQAVVDDSVPNKLLSNRAQKVGKAEKRFTVTFEALLIGHEDWIYTAKWSPVNQGGISPTLLSASADNSLSIWEADESSGVWICRTRLGEISSQKGSTTATGSTGGFWVGLWQPDGTSVVSLGRTGSWRRWQHDSTSNLWTQNVGISGHIDAVRGLAWTPDGSYLLSTSADQTTRAFAEWHSDGKRIWHEFTRPQIHGYDLNCISAITNNRFVSGADEKLLRVFDKPKKIDEIMHRLCGTTLSLQDETLPDAANIPVLGLSNKAITTNSENTDDNDTNEPTTSTNAEEFAPSTFSLPLNHPPLEDHLSRHTLWPEHEKLYGHGYEISCVATSHSSTLLATACKASSIDHAVIRLYSIPEFREIKPPLSAHNLTVTSLSFSPDDTYLLSVGRDRQWTLFEKDDGSDANYKLLISQPKGHTRMILDCSWAPASIGRSVFATAGRDKCIRIWGLNSHETPAGETEVTCIARIDATAPVTAVAFAQAAFDRARDTDHANGADDVRSSDGDVGGAKVGERWIWLAYGTDEGSVTVCRLAAKDMPVLESTDLEPGLRPCKTVNAIGWRPGTGEADNAQLAVGGDDASVRILDISP